MKAFFIALVLATNVAHADIVCNVATHFGPARVAISPHAATVSGSALTKPQVFNSLNAIYDGHMTSLITGPGIAISYETWYGCIHNAHITTNFSDSNEIGYIEHVEVTQCSGGSTSDELCHVGGMSAPRTRRP
jgi:hypothetical protein